jgi:hypothetical protein
MLLTVSVLKWYLKSELEKRKAGNYHDNGSDEEVIIEAFSYGIISCGI